MKSAPSHAGGAGGVFRNLWRRSRGSVSLLIVGICTVLFVAVGLLDLFRIVSSRQAVSLLGLSYVGIVRHFWLYQFLTAPLLHGGVTHLLFNMLSLWMLGPAVERHLGRVRYIIFTLLCAECSMMGFLILSWGTGSITLGYSGVIFGILVAQAILYPNSLLVIFALFPLKMKYAVLLMGGIELYLTLGPQGDRIAHVAHLFGALAALGYFKAPGLLRLMLGRNRVRPVPKVIIHRPPQSKGRFRIPKEL